jgi:hypothetical protein
MDPNSGFSAQGMSLTLLNMDDLAWISWPELCANMWLQEGYLSNGMKFLPAMSGKNAMARRRKSTRNE